MNSLEYLRDLHFKSEWFPQEFKDHLSAYSSKKDLKLILDELTYRKRYDKLSLYHPYGLEETLRIPDWSKKPWQTDFHKAGYDNQERMQMAANRVGKTASNCPETAMHLTGLYPDWWEGRRFDKPILAWVGSPTNESSRDIMQTGLLGGVDIELGTGWIPKECIYGKPSTKQAGMSGVVDAVKVRHVSGGLSTCQFKTYEQGWRKWQGTAPHVVSIDEEPEDNEVQGRIYTEALTRLLTSHGIMMVTFTPLLGVTKLVDHYQQGGDGIWLGTATWDDAPHLDKKEVHRMIMSYPEHEREARTKGVPMMGEGRVFTTPEEDIKVPDNTEIPAHWGRLKGIDFGISHPAAVCDIAWDRDKDVIYITRVWKKAGQDSEVHAQAINEVNPWVPVAWPHDGGNRDKANGIKLKENYVKHGVKMLSMSARYDRDKGGGQPVEPIIMEMQERLRTGGLKVFARCTDWFDEYRNYHRKDGQLTKLRDDALKASMYAIMMKRFCATRGFTSRKKNIPQGFTTRI